MNRLLQSFWALVLTGVIVFSAGTAGAEPAEERVLVVGVSKGRGSDARLVKGLNEHLQRSGLMLAGEALSAQDRACENPDCIEALAQREAAQLVLTAQLQENAPDTVFITMALFDAARRAPFQTTALCDKCTPEALLGKLSDVADKLIKQCHAARQVPVPPPPPLSVPTVPFAGPVIELKSDGGKGGQPGLGTAGFFARLSPRRKLIAGVLGGLAGAALITSIALTATDKQYTSLPCMTSSAGMCRLDNVGLYATGYTLTGALAVGIGVSLFWPTETSSENK